MLKRFLASRKSRVAAYSFPVFGTSLRIPVRENYRRVTRRHFDTRGTTPEVPVVHPRKHAVRGDIVDYL